MPLDDITPYRKYVDHFNISEEQKVQLIHTVWNMMQCAVDQVLGDHPVQHCMELKKPKGLQEHKRPILSLVEQKRSGASKLRK